MTKRYLIVNADDFGQCAGVNGGIIAAHEGGIVTSASLMVRWDAAAQAAEYARENPRLSVGLHFDLGEWGYRSGEWQPLYQVISTEDGGGVRNELVRQLNLFRDRMGRDPTHLDSHQHVHRSEPVRSIMLELGDTIGVPLRGTSPRIHTEGSFYGQDTRGEPLPDQITVENLLKILHALPPGITELSCHPGLGADVNSMYRHEREMEVKSLCDPRICATLRTEDIGLISFCEAAARFL